MPSVINFEYERLKRSDYKNIEVLLEDLLDLFFTSDKESREDLLKKFLKDLDLGTPPLTHLVQAYFKNPNVQTSVDIIITPTPLSILSNIVEFIESFWPQEKILIKKLKILLIGCSIKKLNRKNYSGMLESIESYLLGYDTTLETEIMSPDSNILSFSSFLPHKFEAMPV